MSAQELLERFRPVAGYVSPGGEVWLRHREALQFLDACLVERVAIASFELAREEKDGTMTLFLPTSGSMLLDETMLVTPRIVDSTVGTVREMFIEDLPRAEWWWRDREEPQDWGASAPRATLVAFHVRDEAGG